MRCASICPAGAVADDCDDDAPRDIARMLCALRTPTAPAEAPPTDGALASNPRALRLNSRVAPRPLKQRQQRGRVLDAERLGERQPNAY